MSRNTSTNLNDPVIELNDPRLDPPTFSMDELLDQHHKLIDATNPCALDDFMDGSRTHVTTSNLHSDHDLLYREYDRFIDDLEGFVNVHNADIRELWHDFFTFNYDGRRNPSEMIGSTLFWRFCLHLYLNNRSDSSNK